MAQLLQWLANADLTSVNKLVQGLSMVRLGKVCFVDSTSHGETR